MDAIMPTHPELQEQEFLRLLKLVPLNERRIVFAYLRDRAVLKPDLPISFFEDRTSSEEYLKKQAAFAELVGLSLEKWLELDEGTQSSLLNFKHSLLQTL
jgi:hypothetical protein